MPQSWDHFQADIEGVYLAQWAATFLSKLDELVSDARKLLITPPELKGQSLTEEKAQATRNRTAELEEAMLAIRRHVLDEEQGIPSEW